MDANGKTDMHVQYLVRNTESCDFVLRHDLAVGLMKELLKKFEHSSHKGDLLMANFDVLLTAKDRQALKEFVEFCIGGEFQRKQL